MNFPRRVVRRVLAGLSIFPTAALEKPRLLPRPLSIRAGPSRAATQPPRAATRAERPNRRAEFRHLASFLTRCHFEGTTAHFALPVAIGFVCPPDLRSQFRRAGNWVRLARPVPLLSSARLLRHTIRAWQIGFVCPPGLRSQFGRAGNWVRLPRSVSLLSSARLLGHITAARQIGFVCPPRLRSQFTRAGNWVRLARPGPLLCSARPLRHITRPWQIGFVWCNRVLRCPWQGRSPKPPRPAKLGPFGAPGRNVPPGQPALANWLRLARWLRKPRRANLNRKFGFVSRTSPRALPPDPNPPARPAPPTSPAVPPRRPQPEPKNSRVRNHDPLFTASYRNPCIVVFKISYKPPPTPSRKNRHCHVSARTEATRRSRQLYKSDPSRAKRGEEMGLATEQMELREGGAG